MLNREIDVTLDSPKDTVEILKKTVRRLEDGNSDLLTRNHEV
jgi:hypothetical protein